MIGTQKVALVVDALAGIGGAEKVLMSAMELVPEAPIYTLIYNRKAFQGTPIAARQVITSFIEKLPGGSRHYRKYLPLLPRAIEQFDLSKFDLILSFSYAVAHGVRLQNGQKHLSYTFTPMRYAWRNFGLNGIQQATHPWTNLLLEPFRRWDSSAVAHVERFAAVSRWISDWVCRAYQRESTVIYPPVSLERFSPELERDEYFITINRLVSHKRVDLMVQAFNQLHLPLLVIGEGPERQKLERMAEPNVQFLGYLPDEALAKLLSRARAYICAGEEDFGISMIEAQAAGCPVIAYRKGGALETVLEGQTGLFFNEPCFESLVEAVVFFSKRTSQFNPIQIAASVQRFNDKRFLREFAVFKEG
jgi:glycosyltransferase involved in cell wall biosynthesis